MDKQFNDFTKSLVLSSISNSIMLISNLLVTCNLPESLVDILAGYRATLHYVYTDLYSKDSNEK